MQGRDVAIIVGAIVLVILVLGLLGGGMMGFGGMMGWGGPGYGFGGYGFGWWGILMLLFWVLVIAGIVWLVVWLIQQGRPAAAGPGASGPSALDILGERYARGEITREQYEQMRHDLEGK